MYQSARESQEHLAAESGSAMSTLDIGLIQISESRCLHTYLPYTIGLLQAYALGHARDPARFRFRPPIFERLTVEQALTQLSGVAIAGFSAYCWNIRRSLAIARALKAAQPETLIIFGGPQIPQTPGETEAFLREHPFLDVVALGEGERTFLTLLEQTRSNWPEIPGIAWLAQGEFRLNPSAERIQELDSIPSPYLTGVFDTLMAARPEISWIATWESNRGCPFKCSFCDWGGLLQARVYQFGIERLQAEIEWFGHRQVKDIFCADANFGMLARDIELARRMVSCKQRYGAPHLFQTQTAKNVKVRHLEIQGLLADSGLNPVAAISLQSLSPRALSAIRRENISTESYRELQQFCQARGIYNYTDLIIGLPGESYDSFADGLAEVIRLGQHNRVIFGNAALLPNAEMASARDREAYGIRSIEMLFPAQDLRDEILETLEVIVETHDMSREDWVRIQILAWMSNFLYFIHKPLQILMLMLHHRLDMSFRELIEPFCQPQNLGHYPVLRQIRKGFEASARRQLEGLAAQARSPFMFSLPDGGYLTPDIYFQLKLSQTGNWPRLFQEAGNLLLRQGLARQPNLPMALFQDALKLSEAHFNQHFYGRLASAAGPPRTEPRRLELRYNLWDFYQACLKGQPLPIQSQACVFSYLVPLPGVAEATRDLQALSAAAEALSL